MPQSGERKTKLLELMSAVTSAELRELVANVGSQFDPVPHTPPVRTVPISARQLEVLYFTKNAHTNIPCRLNV